MEYDNNCILNSVMCFLARFGGHKEFSSVHNLGARGNTCGNQRGTYKKKECELIQLNDPALKEVNHHMAQQLTLIYCLHII